GARPPAAETALRLLRGPHGRFHWRSGDDGRPGSFRLHASGDCDWVADCVSLAFGPVVSGNLYARRISPFNVALRSDRVARSADGWQPCPVPLGMGDSWALP